MIRVRRRWGPDAPKAPSEESAFDWPTVEAGWVVPTTDVLGIPTLRPAGWSREIPNSSPTTPRRLLRDNSWGSSVGMAMVAVLRPRSRWWDGLLAMAGLDEAEVSPASVPRSSGAATGRSQPRPTGERPDADLLDLEPAEQLAALTRRHADAVYRVALSVTRNADLAEDVSQDALLKAW